jgi:hypothetical protein
MLLGVFTACGEKDDEAAKDAISETASQSATTLVLYLMSDAPVAPETEKEIEDAVNKITKNKFKTKLDLRIYPEDEYYAKLDAAFAERDVVTYLYSHFSNWSNPGNKVILLNCIDYGLQCSNIRIGFRNHCTKFVDFFVQFCKFVSVKVVTTAKHQGQDSCTKMEYLFHRIEWL